jgi:hypothetical protein
MPRFHVSLHAERTCVVVELGMNIMSSEVTHYILKIIGH